MEISYQTTSTEAALQALDELEARFKHWRQNKSYTRESIPLDLLQSAKSLSSHVGNKLVKDRLGISNTQLKRGDQPSASTVEQNTPDNKQQFVKATVNEAASQAWRIELHSPTGAVVTVSGLKTNPMDTVNQLLEQTYDCA